MTNIFLANLHTLENTHHGRGPVHPVPGVQLNIVAASILYQQERAECTDHKLVNKVNERNKDQILVDRKVFK